MLLLSYGGRGNRKNLDPASVIDSCSSLSVKNLARKHRLCDVKIQKLGNEENKQISNILNKWCGKFCPSFFQKFATPIAGTLG